MMILEKYNSISFIGMSKNAGKTTTLNYFIDKTRGKYTLGLSSIGRDGETVDRVTQTEKPRVYIYAGTIVATSANCYKLSDATLEIIHVTNINTPLGRIIIARAVTDGYVEIAGPSTTYDMKKVISIMYEVGADRVFIDGALSRKSLASPAVAEAAVLSVGASFSNDINKLINETVLTYKLLNIEKLENMKVRNQIEALKSGVTVFSHPESGEVTNMSDSCLAIFDRNCDLVYSECNTIVGKESYIVDKISSETKFIYTSGALTDTFVDSLIKNTGKSCSVSIIVDDGTKLFISNENLIKLTHRKIRLYAIEKINICAITVNPFSTQDYTVDSRLMIAALKRHIDIPVFDVKGEIM